MDAAVQSSPSPTPLSPCALTPDDHHHWTPLSQISQQSHSKGVAALEVFPTVQGCSDHQRCCDAEEAVGSEGDEDEDDEDDEERKVQTKRRKRATKPNVSKLQSSLSPCALTPDDHHHWTPLSQISQQSHSKGVAALEVLPTVQGCSDSQRCCDAEEAVGSEGDEDEDDEDDEERRVQTKRRKQATKPNVSKLQSSRGAIGPRKKKSQWTVKHSPYLNASNSAESFIALLAAAHWESETYDVAGWISEVGEKLKEDSVIFHDDSLGSLVWRCEKLSNLGVRVSFFIMLTQIQLVAKCKRYVVFAHLLCRLITSGQQQLIYS